jgi:cell division septation protein DedD
MSDPGSKRRPVMWKEVSFRCIGYQYIVTILSTLWKGCLVFFLLLEVSCASHRLTSHEGQAVRSLSNPKENQTAAKKFPQCKPLSEGLYVVQAGAFKNISYAQSLRKNLEEKGYDAYITVSGFQEDKRIFRVLVGRFMDKQQAENLSAQIKRTDNLEVIVALKPPKDKFVVQAGCFTEMSSAKALRKKLADKGYNAYITLSGTGNDNKTHNVLVGEFLDREAAENLSEEIRKKENIQACVTTI